MSLEQAAKPQDRGLVGQPCLASVEADKYAGVQFSARVDIARQDVTTLIAEWLQICGRWERLGYFALLVLSSEM